ncbi:hypothetical protein CNYM01_12886 [Colletotrichum nymphaeae SA-01]|uniref:Uncharacterized protein n=1 Tax=Colletotrichum nymphaeae SA-01 TaxID=1460502 RepID=A0A135RSX3_9PEZI|nr:hypothetical protein CNYM01_12886 [Colletotrichum nymphaeae SA-01]
MDNSLWCLAMIGAGVLLLIWRYMSRIPAPYTFLFIVFCYATQATLLKGPGLVLDGILPVLPLIVLSGAFLSSLFLSFWSNITHDAGHGDQDVSNGDHRLPRVVSHLV